MDNWETKNIDRWSKSAETFKKLATESGAKYPPVLSAWVHEREVALITERVKPSSADSVLDLGAGGGRFTTMFAPLCSSVVAVEPSDLITVLRENTKEFANVACLHERIQDVSCRDEFTVAIISGVLMNMPHEDARSCLSKAAKALKKGGVLVLREPVAQRGIVNVDWKYYPQGQEPQFAEDSYFEYYRDSSFYIEACASLGLRHTGTVISHAPVFYFLPDAWPCKKGIQRMVFSLLQHKWSKPLMEVYNDIFRYPYALIMDLLKKKTMRFHFFVK